jgi:hypothetical protein
VGRCLPENSLFSITNLIFVVRSFDGKNVCGKWLFDFFGHYQNGRVLWGDVSFKNSKIFLMLSGAKTNTC